MKLNTYQDGELKKMAAQLPAMKDKEGRAMNHYRRLKDLWDRGRNEPEVRAMIRHYFITVKKEWQGQQADTMTEFLSGVATGKPKQVQSPYVDPSTIKLDHSRN